jgi:hypothetical protein
MGVRYRQKTNREICTCGKYTALANNVQIRMGVDLFESTPFLNGNEKDIGISNYYLEVYLIRAW